MPTLPAALAARAERWFGRPVTGSFDIVFCTLAGGPGTAWAAGLRPGSEVHVIGPSASLRWRPDAQPVLLGDASTVGLFAALIAAAPHLRSAGAIEVPAQDRRAVQRLTPQLDVLSAYDETGSALRRWAAERTLSGNDSHGRRIYLVGHAQTVQRLRDLLRRDGVDRGSIVTKAYWATGRAGL